MVVGNPVSAPVIALPRFRQPPATNDEPLPTVAAPEPAQTWGPPLGPLTATESAESDDSDPLARPPQLPAPEGPTRRSWVGRGHGSGDPRVAARTIAGLLALIFGTAAVLSRRGGRLLRQPTRAQMDDFTEPLGRILVRWLPLDVIGQDLADVTQAAAAGHQYVLDGPLLEPIVYADPEE